MEAAIDISTPKYDFIIDKTFEDKVMACLFRIIEFASVASLHLKPSYFQNPMRQNLAKMAIEFWQNYQAIIKGHSLAHEISELVTKKIINPSELTAYGGYVMGLDAVDISDHKYVLEKLVIFIKDREFRAVINDAVSKYLPKGDFDKLEKALHAAMAISTTAAPVPYAYNDLKNIDTRSSQRDMASKLVARSISTGIPEMDRTLSKKGWHRKELYVIMAPPKRGKTMSLLWFANFAANQGYQVLFFTFETATEVLSDRLDAQNTMIETKMLVGQANHVKTVLKGRVVKGDVHFLEYPTKTCGIGEIERQVSKFERENPKGLDMVVVDYGDLIKPSRHRENKLDEQAEVFESLRGIAGKFNIPVLTATQVNRSGTGKAINDGTDVSGTFEKIMIADEIISLSAKNDELRQGKIRISFTESRNSERKTFLVSTNYATGTFYKDFIKVE